MPPGPPSRSRARDGDSSTRAVDRPANASLPDRAKGRALYRPMPSGTLRPPLPAWRVRRLRIRLLVTALCALAAPVPYAAAPTERSQADARRAEEQLQAVKAEIERVTREVGAEQVERDRLTRQLRGAEIGRAH